MCFSATASFSAAVVLGVIGVVSVRSAPSRRHLALAAIPLLFGAQQACEGALWRVLDVAPFHVSDTPLARAFLFFAVLVWPAYVPFALWMVERDRARRTWLAAFTAAGLALGIYLMACVTLRDSNACIAFGNLYYWIQIDLPIKRVAPFVYIGVIAAPLVISSMRGARVLAAAIVVAFVVTGTLYRAGFVSIWCFCVALLSGLIVLVNRPSGPPRAIRS